MGELGISTNRISGVFLGLKCCESVLSAGGGGGGTGCSCCIFWAVEKICCIFQRSILCTVFWVQVFFAGYFDSTVLHCYRVVFIFCEKNCVLEGKFPEKKEEVLTAV